MSYKIGIKTAVAICVSAIIGDTLFVVTGIPIAQAGAVALLAYILVGIIAVIIGLNLAELSSLMPREKGVSYSYVAKAFGSEMGFITGILLYFGYCAVTSAVSFGFGGYLLALLGLPVNAGSQILIAAILILFISLLNMGGLKRAARLSEVLVVIILLTAGLFLAFAFTHANTSNLQLTLMDALPSNIGNFSIAITTIVFAFAGFQALAGLSDNIKGAGKGVAKAMVYSIVISTLAYIVITVGLLLLSPPSTSYSNPQPLSYALSYVHAPYIVSALVDIGTLFAIAASIVTIVFTSSRLICEIGNDGLLPKITRGINKSGAAVNGIWISAGLSILLLFSGSIYTILSISNFGIIFSWLMACFAVTAFRGKNKQGGYQIPAYPLLTGIGIIACIIFIFGLPSYVLAIGVVFILLLLVIYHTVVKFRYRENRVRLFG